jgi:hypothetical protein
LAVSPSGIGIPISPTSPRPSSSSPSPVPPCRRRWCENGRLDVVR